MEPSNTILCAAAYLELSEEVSVFSTGLFWGRGVTQLG